MREKIDGEHGQGGLDVMFRRCTASKVWWGFVASFSFLVPWVILNLRQRIMCPALELKAFEFLPLSGIVHGYDPHLIYRIMHNVTHPVPLLCYAVVLAYVATRPIFGPVSERFCQLVAYGLAFVHMAFLVSYFASMFLPIGDMISVISR